MAILKYKKSDGTWAKVGNPIPAVTSVNGQTGDVVIEIDQLQTEHQNILNKLDEVLAVCTYESAEEVSS